VIAAANSHSKMVDGHSIEGIMSPANHGQITDHPLIQIHFTGHPVEVTSFPMMQHGWRREDGIRGKLTVYLEPRS
jgi:hypothetical protein